MLQVLPHMEQGGMQRHVVDVARHAAKAGWQIHIASSGGVLERDLIGYKARHVHLPVASTSPWQQLRCMFKLAAYAKANEISLIHAHDPRCGWSAAFAARRANTTFLATAHRVIEGRSGLARLGRRIMVMGDRTIATSHHIGQQLVQQLQAEQNRIRVVYRGIDLAEFKPESILGHRIAALADRWRTRDGRAVVLLPGRVAPDNGHLTALAAMTVLDRDDFDVVIVGEQERDNAYIKKLEREIAAKKLGERVRFGGFCEDMPAALALADLVILPTANGNGSGRILLEAQAMGKPVIVSSVGSFEELVLPASTGWLIQPGDEGELAWALDRALSMEGEVKDRLAKRARDFIAAEFSVERMAERTMAVYDELRRTSP